MKLVSLVLLLFVSLLALSPSGAQVPAAEAQKKALTFYPSLGEKGSKLNEAFIAALEKARASGDFTLQSPEWPLVIAIREAKRLGIPPNGFLPEEIERTAPVIVTAPAPEAEATPLPQPQKSLAQPVKTPWVPKNTTLGGPAGGALDNDPTHKKWGIVGGVFQVADDGVLVRCNSRGGGYKSPGLGSLVFLSNHPDFGSLADGSTVKCTAFESGTYQYENVLGVRRTIKAFTYNAPLY